MTTYYHVAPVCYQAGSDLLSLMQRIGDRPQAEMLAARYIAMRWGQHGDMSIAYGVAWRRGDEPDRLIQEYLQHDAHVICLYRTLTEAHEHRSTWGGVILQIETDTLAVEDGPEGYPAVRDNIPAACVALMEI